MGTKSKKILEEIHPLTLIREIQKWPVLYVKDNPDRTNHYFRFKVWHEIGKALFMDWDTFNDWEKEAKVTDLMKKWRNLRDTFKRQLETEKKIREGHNIKKKTYVYFKHMLYLLPHIASRADEASDPAVEPKLNEFFTRSAKRGRETPVKQDKKVKRKKRPGTHNMSIKSVNIPVTPSKSTDDGELIDEDKHFLMSLVPSFKRMTDDEKLEAKVEILKVIKGIKRNTQGNTDFVDVGYNSQLVDSLPDTIEDTEVKIETITDDLNSSQSNDSESDTENSD